MLTSRPSRKPRLVYTILGLESKEDAAAMPSKKEEALQVEQVAFDIYDEVGEGRDRRTAHVTYKRGDASLGEPAPGA